jgi:hypothetical protein
MIGDIYGQSLGITLVNSQVIISNGLTTTTTTTTTTIKPTTPTTTTSQTISGGGGGSTPVASGVSVITPYVNAQGVFNQSINIWSDDQNSIVSIPAGTTGLTSSGAPLTQISIIHTNATPVFQTGAGMVDLAYDITPNGITFNPAVTITFSVYNLPASLDPITLQIAYYDTAQNTWITVPTTFDATNFTVSAQISHFTVYSVTYGVKANSSVTTTTTTPVVPTTLINSSPISNTTSIPAATVTISSTTSIPVTTSENTAEDQTTLTVSTITNLETNTEITPALETLTMTPKSTKVVRMYILAAIIGVAAFLIAVTASLIWLRRRSLQKNNRHLN